MYFFDTFALFELIKGNALYDKYKDFILNVCILNIAELYWGLLKDVGREKADAWLERYKFEILTIDYDLILAAVAFRYEHKKDDISLAGSVGYLLAKKYKLNFLTGDKFFENKDNIEFVK